MQYDDKDELFDQAVALVLRTGSVSCASLSRYLSIGRARATRIVDQLEEDGYIGPAKNHIHTALMNEKTKHIFAATEEKKKQQESEEHKAIEERYKNESDTFKEYDPIVFFPWTDVSDCLETMKIHPHGETPETFKQDPKNKDIKCPKCGETINNLKVIYFVSPDWTWKKLCGRAGWLVLCDKCKTQVDFETVIMN